MSLVTVDTDALKYPIGAPNVPEVVTMEMVKQAIEDIREFPASFVGAVSVMAESDLDRPYRPEAWTARQLIHHMADSHMVAYVNLKNTLTIVEPVIAAYDDKLWAESIDNNNTPIQDSVDLVTALHKRWVLTLENMVEADFQRKFQGWGRTPTLAEATLIYAWHGKHHVAHLLNMMQK